MKRLLLSGLLLLNTSLMAAEQNEALSQQAVLNAIDASLALRGKYNKDYERNADSAVKDEISALLEKSGFDSLIHYHSVVGRILNAYLVHKKQTSAAGKPIQDADIQASAGLSQQQKASILAVRKVAAKVGSKQQARAQHDMPAVLAHLSAVEQAFDHPLRKSPPGAAHHHH